MFLLLALLACTRPGGDWTVGDGVEPIDRTTPVPPAEPAPQWADSDRHVVLVSLDGFRHDYLDRVPTPTLDRLVAEGVRAEALVPVFPTKTFPNHVTQVTGLHPVDHGIVGNSFFDDDLGQVFDMEATGSEWFGGEPIWITATRQGLRAATLFWPGSETAYDGLRQDTWVAYDGDLANEDRVDQLLAWFDEDQPPHFATLYFSDVDHAGHSQGPDGQDVDAAVAAVDRQLGRLVAGFEARGLLDTVDLVIVADHGMTQLSRERAIFLDDHVDVDAFYILAWGPYVTLDPVDGDTTGVLEALVGLPHATCSDAASRPPELHFPSGPRVPPILCIAELGWGLTSRPWFDTHPDDLTGGTHGYLPEASDMHGLFVARGPHVAQGVTVPAFSNLDVHELLAALLDIEPAPNAGDPEATAAVRR